MDMEKLIACVKTHQCLYDKTHRDYKSVEMKKHAWKEIAETLGTDEFDVERLWRNLRDRFSREIRKKSTWKLLGSMEFLRSHVISRPIGIGDPRLDNDLSISSTQTNPYPYDTMDRMALIRLVKEHECIYNRRFIGYKSKDMKKKAWRKIASAMGIDKEQCMHQWVSLRDRYSREIRRITALNNNGMSPEHLWHFYDHMEFLRPHILPRGNRNSYFPSQSTKNQTDNEDYVVDHENTADGYEYETDPFESKALSEQEIDHEDIDDISNQQHTARTSKGNCKSEVQQELCSALEMFKQVCGRIRARNQNPIIQGFGQMIVETICSMSERKQALAMQKVTELVMNIKMQPEMK